MIDSRATEGGAVIRRRRECVACNRRYTTYERVEETGRLSLALSRFFVPKDILVFTRDEVSRWAGSRNHVIARALREGRVLYERA